MLSSNDLLVNPQFINLSRNEFEDEVIIPTFNPVFDLTKSLEKDEIDLLGMRQQIYKQIYSTGARCGVIYGLTKDGSPIRKN